MATKTITTCDRCGEVATSSDLRSFLLTERKLNGEEVAAAETELCAGCERGLHDVALPFFPADEAEHLRGIVR